MDTVTERYHGGASGNKYERAQLPLEEMFQREVDPETGAPTPIRSLFEYWQDRHSKTLPEAGAFNPKSAFTPVEFRWICWVDVRPSDPLDYVLRCHPGEVFGDWSNKRLREYHDKYHGRRCAMEYLTCKMVKKPFYHEIRQTIGAVRRHYTRLLLPVVDRSREVVRLHYGINLIDYETPPA